MTTMAATMIRAETWRGGVAALAARRGAARGGATDGRRRGGSSIGSSGRRVRWAGRAEVPVSMRVAAVASPSICVADVGSSATVESVGSGAIPRSPFWSASPISSAPS